MINSTTLHTYSITECYKQTKYEMYDDMRGPQNSYNHIVDHLRTFHLALSKRFCSDQKKIYRYCIIGSKSIAGDNKMNAKDFLELYEVNS